MKISLILFAYSKKRLPFILKSELIIKTGPINKRKGFFSKKRTLILTDFPRLIYVDQEKNSQKGEIYWSSRMVVELKNKRNFFIHTVCIFLIIFNDSE
jgi:3-phosphoinositide dependent protein kinase-1